MQIYLKIVRVLNEVRLLHLIPTIISQSRYNPHFTDKETMFQKAKLSKLTSFTRFEPKAHTLNHFATPIRRQCKNSFALL
jgi:hypothetical protein